MTVACVPSSPTLCLAPPASTEQHDERCRELLWGAPPDLMSQIMAFLSSLIQTWDRVFYPFDASHKLRGWSLHLRAYVGRRSLTLLKLINSLLLCGAHGWLVVQKQGRCADPALSCYLSSNIIEPAFACNAGANA